MSDQGFFEDVLPNSEGWVPILSKSPTGQLTNFRWYHWPSEKQAMVEYIETISHTDVYFSPMLFSEPPSRTTANWARKANVTKCVVVTADGDSMDIDKLRVPPTTVVRSSKNHWQGYWRFTDSEAGHLSNFDFEDMSHGLYDAHAEDGMDRGWPLAVKRRVPFTTNTKPQYGLPFTVGYETDMSVAVTAGEFAAEYEPAQTVDLSVVGDLPQSDENDAITILARVGSTLVNDLFLIEPPLTDDWSSRLYQLECLLFEAGATVEEVFVVANEAACNKFRRDGRPDYDLWVQVNRDHARWESSTVHLDIDLEFELNDSEMALPTIADATPDGLYWNNVSFIRDEERSDIPDNTFLDSFTTWAQGRSSQSPWEFNVAGACALLSTTLGRYAKIPLSFGDMPLNLYFMVLGRTTQSRKSTSLRLARSIVRDITAKQQEEFGVDGESNTDDEYWIPDDATPEALIDYLNTKPRRSSLYAVDEWQDTLAAASKKGSYIAGLIPFLTKAYDGIIPGVLRKTGTNKYHKGTDHYLSFYGTGIFNQAAEALSVERIESGFVPRTLIVVDQRDGFTPGADDIRFMDESDTRRSDSIRRVLSTALVGAIKYWDLKYQERASVCTYNEDPRCVIQCDDDAFRRWQVYAYDVGLLAANHPTNPRQMFPVCERMSFSVLKVAALLALVERSDTIRMRHVLKAIAVADTWAKCSEALVNEVCNNGFAKQVREIETYVSSQTNSAVRYEHLLTKFQSHFDDPRQLRSVLDFCQQKGTLKDIIVNMKTGERVLQYVSH